MISSCALHVDRCLSEDEIENSKNTMQDGIVSVLLLLVLLFMLLVILLFSSANIYGRTSMALTGLGINSSSQG